MATITAQGIGSGLDVKSIVDQLVSAEKTPAATRLATKQATASSQLTGIGRLKAALATFQTAVGKLADIDQFQQRKATVSDGDRASVSVTADAAPGSYQLEIDTLASAHRLVSPAFTSADAVVGAGQLRIGSGTGSMQIEITSSNNTLAGIRDAINASANNPGVRASIVTGADGAHLILAATSTGAGNAITVDAVAPGSPLEVLEFGTGTTNGMTEAVPAADATATIDGLPITSPTNSIGSAIPGVTIDLLKAESGVPVTLEVSYDKEAARQSVGRFIDAYNAVVNTISSLTSYNADTKQGGVLLGDAATRAIRGSLRNILGGTVGDGSASFRSLAEIGITTKADSTLSLDATKFDAATTADFDTVGRILADDKNGIAVRMKSVVDDVLGSNGRIATKEQTLKAQLKDLDSRQTALDARMEQVKARYQKQFFALDTLMSQLTRTSSYLTAQLSKL